MSDGRDRRPESAHGGRRIDRPVSKAVHEADRGSGVEQLAPVARARRKYGLRPVHLMPLVTLLLAMVMAPLAWPTAPVRAQTGGRQPVSACTVAVTETRSATPRPACEPADVGVTMDITCPTSLPMHIVFVIGRHLLMEDHLDDVKRSARDMLDAIDFTAGTQVGVVSVSLQERVEQELTDSKGQAMSAINRIRLDAVNPLARYTDWLGRAQLMLERARDDGAAVSPIEIIVVFSTGCPDVAGAEQYCNRQVGSANQARGQGITVAGICNPNARPFGLPFPLGEHCRWIRDMASTGYYYDLNRAGRAAQDVTDLGRTGDGLQLSEVRFLEELAPGVQWVSGSLSGTAVVTPTAAGSNLLWRWENVAPGARLTATYRITPPGPGVMPLRTDGSQVRMLDTLGRASNPQPLPTRDLEFESCPTPTATPTQQPPTATASPMPEPSSTPVPTSTVTATSTARPEDRHVYLPALLQRVCRPEDRRFDVVLAIDASSSMAVRVGDRTGIEGARAAASAFVDRLDLAAGDRAAVVSFHGEAAVELGLSSDRAAIRSAIEAVTVGRGTRIDRALDATAGVLDRRERSDHRPVVVLLTDGRPEEGTAEITADAARRMIDGGVTLFVIGLGERVDTRLLERLAGDPERMLLAPSPADLDAAFGRIAGRLPCPGGVLWPRP